MGMSKKDFNLIADTLKSVRESYGKNWDANLARACDDHAKEFAIALAQTNENFDKARFLKACGYGGQCG